MDNQTIRSNLIDISQQLHLKSGIGWFINFQIDLLFKSQQKHWKQLQWILMVLGNGNKVSDK